jgi:hypothetical protein
MLKRMIKRVLFGRKRRKNYKGINKKSMGYNYVSWHAHDMLSCRLDNLLKHLKLQRIGNHSLIGDKKDAEKFKDQFDY